MNIKFDLTPYKPPYGEKRIRSAFLWFPKYIEGRLRWLERATWVEKYDYAYYSDICGENIWWWKGVEWIA